MWKCEHRSWSCGTPDGRFTTRMTFHWMTVYPTHETKHLIAFPHTLPMKNNNSWVSSHVIMDLLTVCPLSVSTRTVEQQQSVASARSHVAAIMGIERRRRTLDRASSTTSSDGNGNDGGSDGGQRSDSPVRPHHRTLYLSKSDTQNNSGQNTSSPSRAADTDTMENDPATPPHARAWCRDKREKGRRRWRRQSPPCFEVTKSPSYLQGTGGFILSSPPVTGNGRRNGPSSRASLTSSSPKVSTGRMCKKSTPPLRGKKHRASASSGGCTGCAGDRTGHDPSTNNGIFLQPFLPPPPLQRDSCGGRNGANTADRDGGPGGGALFGGVPTTPIADRRQEGFRQATNGASIGAGNLRTGPASAYGVVNSPGTGSGYCSGNPPTTPSGSCSTPGICSPPETCHSRGVLPNRASRGRGRGTTTGERDLVRNKRLNRLRGCENVGKYPIKRSGGCAKDSDGLEGVSGDVVSGVDNDATGSRRPGCPRSRLGRMDDDDGSRGSRYRDTGQEEADGIDMNGGGTGRVCGDGDGIYLDEGRSKRRDHSPQSSSSVENFSDYFDEDGMALKIDRNKSGFVAEEAFDSRGEGMGGSRRGAGLRRRRRTGRGFSTAASEEESVEDFSGRVAAIASATRICVASNNASVMATPPQPIPRVTTPLVPRRRHPSPVSTNSPPLWSAPSRENENLRNQGGAWVEGGGTSGLKAGTGVVIGTPTFGGREVGLRPSEKTVSGGRLWPDFDDLRYKPSESEITTPLRRSDWKIEHGSALHTLQLALEAATAGKSSGTSSLDLRAERRNSMRQRYLERSEHFRLIQAARESAATQGSAMLRVMLECRAAEEAARKAEEIRATRMRALKDKILMRMMKSRRGVFLAWARQTTRSRKARELLSLRVTSHTRQVFVSWRDEAHRQRRVREFVLRYIADSKRMTFMAWRDGTTKSIAARRMALVRLQGSQKACFVAWRHHTKVRLRARKLAMQRSEAARSALNGLAGSRGLFMRWKAWANKMGAAKRMADRLKDAELRRCFRALADNQLRIRRSLEERRMHNLHTWFTAWRVGLGCLLRERLLPAVGDICVVEHDSTEAGNRQAKNGSRNRSAKAGKAETLAVCAADLLSGNVEVVTGNDRRNGSQNFSRVGLCGVCARVLSADEARVVAENAGVEASTGDVERKGKAREVAQTGLAEILGKQDEGCVSSVSRAIWDARDEQVDGSSEDTTVVVSRSSSVADRGDVDGADKICSREQCTREVSGEWTLSPRANNTGREEVKDEGIARPCLLPPSAFFLSSSTGSPRSQQEQQQPERW